MITTPEEFRRYRRALRARGIGAAEGEPIDLALHRASRAGEAEGIFAFPDGDQWWVFLLDDVNTGTGGCISVDADEVEATIAAVRFALQVDRAARVPRRVRPARRGRSPINDALHAAMRTALEERGVPVDDVPWLRRARERTDARG